MESAVTKPLDDRSASTVHFPKSGDAACATGSAFRTPPLTTLVVEPRRCGMDVRRFGSVESASSSVSSAPVMRSGLASCGFAGGASCVSCVGGVMAVLAWDPIVRVLDAVDFIASSWL